MKFIGLLLLAIFFASSAQAGGVTQGPCPEPRIESVLINGEEGKDFSILADSQFEAVIQISESRSNYMILSEFDDQYFDNISEWQDGMTYHIVFDVKDRTGKNKEIKFRIFDGDFIYDSEKAVRFDIWQPEAIRFDVISPGDNAEVGQVRFEARVTRHAEEGGDISWRWYADGELVSSFNGHTAYLEEGVHECHVEALDELGNTGSQDFTVFVKEYDKQKPAGRRHQDSGQRHSSSDSPVTEETIIFEIPERMPLQNKFLLDLSGINIVRGDVVYVNITKEFNEVESHRYTYEEGADWLKPAFRFDTTGKKTFQIQVYSKGNLRKHGEFEIYVYREVNNTQAEPAAEVVTDETFRTTTDNATVTNISDEDNKSNNETEDPGRIAMSPNFKKFISALKWFFE